VGVRLGSRPGKHKPGDKEQREQDRSVKQDGGEA
jgi:hypothetical protein